MKYKIKVTVILLALFLVTQFIGLFVVNHYVQKEDSNLPYGMSPPEVKAQSDFYTSFLPSIIIAFVFAVIIIFLLTKFNAEFILRLWFIIVIIIALSISLLAFLPQFKYASLIILIITIPLALIKIYKRHFIVHNLTELFIYPGIAAVFVPLLNTLTAIILLILISIYDMWAVWKSGIMQKMAKYQINTLKVFGGFFVPYASKKVKEKIKKMKPSELKNKKVGINLAILGGGDIIFPIITAGVMLKAFGLTAALFVIFGALLGLTYLLFNSEKKKFYPAMPFISSGIFLGMILWKILF